MAITAAMVKELREKSGAGMMDCKKALTETDGNMEKAVEFLREKGLASAAKKADRIAAEGIVATNISADHKTAAIVEVNSETDFVAKNEKFQNFVADVAAQVATTTAADVDAFMAEAWAKDTAKTVTDELNSQIAIIGEKMTIRRFEKITVENGFVESYIHAGGKIGVVVEFAGEATDANKECARNVAMQVAALAPKYVDRSEVSEEYIAHETEILKVQATNENPGKPENIIEKMVVGRLNKELKEVCLVDQTYVKDGDFTVGKYIASVDSSLKVLKFVRFETGEGIEKKEENFAEEVAKQMGM